MMNTVSFPLLVFFFNHVNNTKAPSLQTYNSNSPKQRRDMILFHGPPGQPRHSPKLPGSVEISWFFFFSTGNECVLRLCLFHDQLAVCECRLFGNQTLLYKWNGPVEKKSQERDSWVSLESTAGWYMKQVLENEWGGRQDSTERVMLEPHLEHTEM